MHNTFKVLDISTTKKVSHSDCKDWYYLLCGSHNDLGFAKVNVPKNQVCKLVFDDVEKYDENYETPTAEEVWKGISFFRNAHTKNKKIVFGCNAGICRSSAMALLYLYDCYKDKQFVEDIVAEKLWEKYPYVSPNILVVKIGLELILHDISKVEPLCKYFLEFEKNVFVNKNSAWA
jgi:predicted protein tyrosine phosphatase